MTYRKPEVVAVGSAVSAIQSSTRKIHQVVADAANLPATAAAYEADE
jgi:hypothetical protein